MPSALRGMSASCHSRTLRVDTCITSAICCCVSLENSTFLCFITLRRRRNQTRLRDVLNLAEQRAPRHPRLSAVEKGPAVF